MLTIPEALEIARSKASEQVLLDRCRAWLEREERKPGLHASDLLDPRMAYFKRKYPVPLSDRLVYIFLVGKLAHALVLSAVDGKNGFDFDSDEGSVWDEELGIWYSADKTINGIPRELKTTRSFYEAKTHKDLELYTKQLCIYMAALRSLLGQLWILYLNLQNDEKKTSPSMRVFTVQWTEQDIENYRADIKRTVKMLNYALEADDPSELPNCAQFKCGPGNCEFWDKCKPEGRYPLKTKASWKN